MISHDQLTAALAIVLWTLYLWNRKDMKGISMKASGIDREARRRHQEMIALEMEDAAPDNDRIRKLAQMVRNL